MARPSTGAWTVYESLRIEMPYMLKQGYIKKGSVRRFDLSWSDQHGRETGCISCKSSYLDTPQNQYLEVSYIITRSSGEKISQHYKVRFAEVPSNLGKGTVLYFICPDSGKRCRILYKAYGCLLFKCREAYTHRLYYECQHSSKLDIYNDIYWRLDKRLEGLKKDTCRGKRTYKGLLTKKAQRYNRMWHKQCQMDSLRWTLGVPKRLSGVIDQYR